MTMYARVVSGVVVETFTPLQGFQISQCFSPDLPGVWTDCTSPSGVAEFWTFDGTAFHAPALPLST